MPTLLRQTVVYFAANAVAAAFGLINVVLFTRLLGTADYGVYVIGTSLATILSSVLFTWLKRAALREEAKAGGSELRATILLGALLCGLAAPAFYPLLSPLIGLAPPATAAAILLAVSGGLFDIGQEVLRAKMRAESYLRSTLVRAVAATSLGSALVLAGGGGAMLLLSGATAFLAGAALCLRDLVTGAKLKLRDERLVPLFLLGLPLTVSMSILAVSAAVDRFIVGALLGPAAAGQYGASVDLVRQALIIPAISASSAFAPMALRLLASEGEAAARRHLAECFELLAALMLPACVGLALVSSATANLILGPEFRQSAAQLMPVICLAVVFQVAVNQYFHIGFLMAERTSIYLASAASMLVFNVVASTALVSAIGLSGAAWARVATEAFGLVGALVLVRRAFALPLPLARLARVAAATAAMAAAVLRFPPDRIGLVLSIFAGALVYALACWFLDVAQMRARLVAALSPASRAAAR
jgi:O-antigen/teichoic acid export membrane protein